MSGRKKKILVLFVFTVFSGSLAVAAEEEQLSSPLIARTFYDIGRQLYTDKQADILAAKQAIIFLNAAINLDNKANYILPEIINIAWQYPNEDFSDAVELALKQYVDRSSDLEVTSKAVGYLLERLDAREDREKLLLKLLGRFQQKNAMFESDLAAQLGFLKAETADSAEAQKYLMQAFAGNQYNRLAFAKLVELSDAGDKHLSDVAYLYNLRFAVRANPLDFVSAYSFAQHAEMMGLYEPALEAYRYCIELAGYLEGDKTVRIDLYRPLLLNCYNAAQYSRCQQIAWQLRRMDVFDVQIEGIAAAAALQNKDENALKPILDGMESHSNEILTGRKKVSPSQLIDYAWFFNFITDVNSQEDLTWATKAYDAEPNSINTASLFAYALVKNNQLEVAESLLEKIGTETQAAGLAKGIILLQKGDLNSGKEMLKKVITALPGSFEAQKAKEKLKEVEPDYMPPNMNELKMKLQKDFGRSFFGQFVEPEKMVTMEFNIKGSTFSYGNEITGNIAIINNYSEPMVVCPDAMLKGNIRIDVEITGDLTERIPALIVKTVRPSYEIRPGSALFIPFRLDTDRVRHILDCYPQADLKLKCTAYLDPLVSADGRVKDTLMIKPAEIVLKRHKLQLNLRYLQQRFDALKRGHQGQKIKSAQLFAGLLTEQQRIRQAGKSYQFMYVEPELLSSALARCLSEDDWILNVQTMAAMLKLKPDYRLVRAVSWDLDNTNWPARLMAVFTLAKNQNREFSSVLDWAVKNDPQPIVRQLAVILGGNAEMNADSNSPQITPDTAQKTALTEQEN